jgi:predicted transcriptional regulator
MQYELKHLRQIRKQLGLTQTEFAKEAGVSQSLIAKIESESIDPTYSKVKQLFDATDRLSRKKELCAKEVMQTGIITAKPADRIVDVVKLMSKNAISQLPILEGRNIVGMITEKDLLEHLGSENVHSMKAKEAMVEPPPIISEDTNISAINQLIRHYPLILVARKGELSGIITKSDILNKII